MYLSRLILDPQHRGVRRELGDAVTRLRKANEKAPKQLKLKRERSSNG